MALSDGAFPLKLAPPCIVYLHMSEMQ
jgi:hypothetical protein